MSSHKILPYRYPKFCQFKGKSLLYWDDNTANVLAGITELDMPRMSGLQCKFMPPHHCSHLRWTLLVWGFGPARQGCPLASHLSVQISIEDTSSLGIYDTVWQLSQRKPALGNIRTFFFLPTPPLFPTGFPFLHTFIFNTESLKLIDNFTSV